MTAPSRARLVHEPDGLCYERTSFVGVRAACPRCPWRAPRNHAAGTYRWRAWLALDLAQHHCAHRPDHQETP